MYSLRMQSNCTAVKTHHTMMTKKHSIFYNKQEQVVVELLQPVSLCTLHATTLVMIVIISSEELRGFQGAVVQLMSGLGKHHLHCDMHVLGATTELL